MQVASWTHLIGTVCAGPDESSAHVACVRRPEAEERYIDFEADAALGARGAPAPVAAAEWRYARGPPLSGTVGDTPSASNFDSMASSRAS